MRDKKWTAILLLLLVTLTAAATDGIQMRNCRPMAGSVPSYHHTAIPSYRHTAIPSYRHTAINSPLISKFSGDRRQLVVLVAFSDQDFQEESPLGLWNRVFNEEHYNVAPFYGSVHDYFYDQSYGQFRLAFDLHYIKLNESKIKYRSTSKDDENSKYLVCDLVDTLSLRGLDWSPYDWDDDGYIDQLLIVYAGKGQNAGGGSSTIWPHQWWLSQHNGVEPRTVSSGGKDYLVDCYCCVQELSSRSDYGTFGTICHEYSHCFGFPDFYYGSASFLYSWDLMDYGNNNSDGFCPPNYSAHERWLMGWLTPEELTGPATISDMASTAEAPQAYLIRNDGYDDEYYMVENRQPIGWDQSLSGSGLVVFHIDYDEQVWRELMPNNGRDNHYTIIPANNLSMVSYCKGWAYPYGSNNQLTDDSQPSASLRHANGNGAMLMSKPLTNITVTDGLASFDFMGGTAGISQHPTPGTRQPIILYNLGPIRIVRMPDGQIKKVFR